MYKRLIALVLSLLLAAVLPIPALAETLQEKEAQVAQAIASDYQTALQMEQKESLAGYCGRLAAYQLYLRGINTSMYSANGNDCYELYSQSQKTTGGYYAKAYPAQEYSLEQALNAVSDHGTRDMYNLLVCFEKTNTEAGQLYGHVVFIYAILDGTVYFTESFASSLNPQAGAMIAVSVERFVRYYADWTVYEGLVAFGLEDYLDNCVTYESNLFAQAADAVRLLTMPGEPEITAGESRLLRTAASGERLRVTGLYKNTWDQYYYQIQEGDTVCYGAADKLQPILFLKESAADYYLLKGQPVQNVAEQPQGRKIDLVSRKLEQVSTVKDGWHYEQDTWYYYEQGARRTGWVTTDGIRYYLQPDGTVTTGWVEIDGHLRCFTATGAMRIGWMDVEAGRQYLQSDGTPVTGWQDVEGKRYYFDHDGLMQKDCWITSGSVRCYMKPDGSMATGWVEMEEGCFGFDIDGRLTAQRVEEDGQIVIRSCDKLPQTHQTEKSRLPGKRDLYIEIDALALNPVRKGCLNVSFWQVKIFRQLPTLRVTCLEGLVKGVLT